MKLAWTQNPKVHTIIMHPRSIQIHTATFRHDNSNALASVVGRHERRVFSTLLRNTWHGREKAESLEEYTNYTEVVSV